MNKITLLILVLLSGASTIYGQIANKQLIELSKHDLNGVYAEWVASNNKYIEVRISNFSRDTVYLFSSYLYDYLYISPELHRYNSQTNECIVSFLPLPYYLHYTRSCDIVLYPYSVTRKFTVLYKFEEITPMSYISIFLPTDCFNYDYVEDYDPRYINKWTEPIFEKVETAINCRSRKIEFAVYKNIDNINKDNYYFKEYIFNQASKDYEVVSVIVGC